MSENSELHPSEKLLLDDCKEVGLNEKQTEIMRDLFGWKDRGHSYMPSLRYLSLLSFLVGARNFMRGDSRAVPNDEMRELADLMTTLLGKELTSLMRVNPIHVLGDVFNLHVLSQAWVVVLFQFEACYPIFKTEIDTLCYSAPERIAVNVMHTIGILMQKVKTRGA